MPAKRIAPEIRFPTFIEPCPMTGCWLWTGGTDYDGYGIFTVHGPKQIKAHRYSYQKHYGPIPEGMFVLHRCDVPQCVNPAHLFVGTHSENMQDMIRKGRQNWQIGERCWSARLNAEQAVAIRGDERDNEIIAREYGVSNALVWRIKKRLAWKHV